MVHLLKTIFATSLLCFPMNRTEKGYDRENVSLLLFLNFHIEKVSFSKETGKRSRAKFFVLFINCCNKKMGDD